MTTCKHEELIGVDDSPSTPAKVWVCETCSRAFRAVPIGDGCERLVPVTRYEYRWIGVDGHEHRAETAASAARALRRAFRRAGLAPEIRDGSIRRVDEERICDADCFLIGRMRR